MAAVDGALLVIAGSTIAGNAGTGILLGAAAPSSRIEDCTVERNSGQGIFVGAVRGCSVIRNRIRDNGVGIVVVEGATPHLEGNDLAGNSTGIGVRGEGSDPVVIGNTVAGTRYAGVIVDEAAGGRFEGNTVSGAGGAGVWVDDEGSTPTFSGNEVTRSAGAGVLVTDGAGGEYRSNDLRGNAEGSWMLDEPGDLERSREPRGHGAGEPRPARPAAGALRGSSPAELGTPRCSATTAGGNDDGGINFGQLLFGLLAVAGAAIRADRRRLHLQGRRADRPRARRRVPAAGRHRERGGPALRRRHRPVVAGADLPAGGRAAGLDPGADAHVPASPTPTPTDADPAPAATPRPKPLPRIGDKVPAGDGWWVRVDKVERWRPSWYHEPGWRLISAYVTVGMPAVENECALGDMFFVTAPSGRRVHRLGRRAAVNRQLFECSDYHRPDAGEGLGDLRGPRQGRHGPGAHVVRARAVRLRRRTADPAHGERAGEVVAIASFEQGRPRAICMVGTRSGTTGRPRCSGRVFSTPRNAMERDRTHGPSRQTHTEADHPG